MAVIKLKRRTSGVVGSPSALASGELAFNEAGADQNLYYGSGDDGAGNATSIITIGGFGSGWLTKSTALRLDQFAAATAALTGVDPTQPQHLATKNYVDTAVQGLDPKASVQYASTAALATYTVSGGNVLTASANAALTLDGGAPAAGARVLIKDEGTAANNGIYTVTQAGSGTTPWILTRATDFNAWTEIPSAFVFIEQGATLADTGWTCTADQGGTLGTTSISFVQFSSAGIVLAGNGLTKSGNTVSVLADPVAGGGITVSAAGVRVSATYAGQSTITTLGTITTGTWQGTTLAVGFGGTGLTAAVNGLMKGNGTTAYSAAVAGTDYLAPAGGATITTLGTIATGTWQATIVGQAYGGTGTNLTTITDGSILKRSGTALAAAVANTDYLATTWTGSTNIVTVGTITTGTWSGTAIAATKGGTGLTVVPTGLIKGSAGAYSAATAGTDYLAPAGGTTVTTLGTITTGVWQGTAVGVANGGTGLTSVPNGLLKGNAGAYSAAVAGTDYLAPTSTIDGGTF